MELLKGGEMITIINPTQFLDIRNNKSQDLIADLIEMQKVRLRYEFDTALTDAHARACIDIADTLGFFELTEEMKQDLEIEKLLNH